MEEIKKGISRRTFLTGTGAALGGLAAGAAIGFSAETALAAAPTLPMPWPSSALDANTVRSNAYTTYGTAVTGGCCSGTAKGIIDTAYAALTAEQKLEWDKIPMAMFPWGAGGGAGWGTLCGSVNAGAMLLNLTCFTTTSAGDKTVTLKKAVDELMNWYCTFAFPSAEVVAQALTTYTINTSVANSPLCHQSVSTWASKYGYKISDGARGKRCALVAADVAWKTCEIIHKVRNLDGAGLVAFAVPAKIATCHACHDGTATYSGDNKWKQQGKMDCKECHAPGALDTGANAFTTENNISNTTTWGPGADGTWRKTSNNNNADKCKRTSD